MVEQDESWENFIAAKRRRQMGVAERLKQLQALEEGTESSAEVESSSPRRGSAPAVMSKGDCGSMVHRRKLVQARLRTLAPSLEDAEVSPSPTAQRRVRSMDAPISEPEAVLSHRRVRSHGNSALAPTPDSPPWTRLISATSSTASTRAGSVASTRASNDDCDLASLPENLALELPPRPVVFEARAALPPQQQGTPSWPLKGGCVVRPLAAARVLRTPAVLAQKTFHLRAWY